MTLTTKTRFNIGETVYFLNFDHKICVGTVKRIDSDTVVYTDKYTGKQSCYTTVRYDVHIDGKEDYTDDSYAEENLYSTPDEIVAMFNDQIQQGDFS